MTNAAQPYQALLSFLYHNISGLRARTHILHDMLLTTAHDIIICNETFFDENTNVAEITNGTEYASIYRVRTMHG